jgi:multiple sugar transport system ATP-binding protein
VARVELKSVSKKFGGVVAINDLSLVVADGELLVILGPSGCGKSTALRLIAGLDEPDVGEITIGDRVINDVDPKDRNVAMVFQSYALYPHMSVARNLEFPLRQRGIDREQRDRIVSDVAKRLGLTEMLARKPAQLSGGQRQRVALGRAIVREPDVFLMDEPLSNLDAALRIETRAEIAELQRELATTTLYVTHDQVEAMTMGDRIAIMNDGALQQVDTPETVYSKPSNVFVATFIGNPGMNVFSGTVDPATVSPGDSVLELLIAGNTLSIPADGELIDDVRSTLGPRSRSTTGSTSGSTPGASNVLIGVRPEDASLVSDGGVEGNVVIVESLGSEAHVIVKLHDNSTFVVRQDHSARRPSPGEPVNIALDVQRVTLFDPETKARIGR